MYNIYINERLLKLCSEKDSLIGADLVFRLSGEESKQFVKDLVDSFEKQPQLQSMILACSNIDKTWETFKKNYVLIDAAGGMVFNSENFLLMIYRHERWDLPKGKIETNEDPDAAALREVEEECGVQNLKLEKQLSTTYHTYNLKGELILKRTYWFMMTTDETIFNPQTEEGITEVRWINRSEIKKACTQSYANIVSLLNLHGLI